jgi:pilus assembly protein CpaF
MNTGHDGSMATLHSNSPRECLARMENMVMMSDIKVPKDAISRQIADSVDLIVQVSASATARAAAPTSPR